MSKGKVKEAEHEWHQLSIKISGVVDTLLAARKISRSRFAVEVGYPSSVLFMIFNAKPDNETAEPDKKKKPQGRYWSMPLLLLTASFFGVTVGDIITAAQTGGGEALLFRSRIASTSPHSEERLGKIVRAAAPEGTSKEVLDLLYTAPMFELAAPDYVHKYLDGGLFDDAVYALLKGIADKLAANGNFWGEVKKAVGHNDNGVFSEAK